MSVRRDRDSLPNIEKCPLGTLWAGDVIFSTSAKCVKSAKCAKCAKSPQLFFFEPSGGKSDAADPFLIVPMSISVISGRHVSRCLGGNREAKSIAC